MDGSPVGVRCWELYTWLRYSVDLAVHLVAERWPGSAVRFLIGFGLISDGLGVVCEAWGVVWDWFARLGK